jgi:hypothetical protein
LFETYLERNLAKEDEEPDLPAQVDIFDVPQREEYGLVGLKMEMQVHFFYRLWMKMTIQQLLMEQLLTQDQALRQEDFEARREQRKVQLEGLKKDLEQVKYPFKLILG